jgi:hypothetical protein
LSFREGGVFFICRLDARALFQVVQIPSKECAKWNAWFTNTKKKGTCGIPVGNKVASSDGFGVVAKRTGRFAAKKLYGKGF